VSPLVPSGLAAVAVAVAVGLPAPRRTVLLALPVRERGAPSALLTAGLAFGLLVVPAGPVAAAVGALLAVLGRRALGQRRARKDRHRERLAAGEAMAVLASELRAGRSPSAALTSAATVAVGPTALALAEAGGSTSLGAGAAEALLRRAQDSAVPELLSGLAVCWQVCQGAGSSLAVAVDRLEEALRADQVCREEVEAELEGPRSTALLLAGLPLFGLALGSGLGGDPLHLLLRTPIGWACLVAGVGLEPTGRRLGVIFPRAVPAHAPTRTPRSRLPACAVGGLVTWWVLGGPLGLVLGSAVAAGGPHALARLDDRNEREEQALAQQLPLALDLLAACLAGGGSLAEALRSVSRAVGGSCAERFSRVAAALAVGSPPEAAFAELGSDGAGGSAGRALCRASEGGSPVAGAVARVAEDARRRARLQARKRARRAGVMAAGPLTLCFLPAFLLIGVVPCVVGLLGPLVTGL
jgi:tight adherence protein B